MKIRVEWEEHNRTYTIGIRQFLAKMGIDVDDAKIIQTIKNLLEQEELNAESKPKREV